VSLFTRDVPPELLEAPVNVLRASLHPRGFASRIINLSEWRGHLLERVRRQVTLTADPELAALYEELRAYPGEPTPPVVTEHNAVVVPLRVRSELGELAFFSIVASIGTPNDITVSELVIESFFPADHHTAAILQTAFTAEENVAAPAAPSRRLSSCELRTPQSKLVTQAVGSVSDLNQHAVRYFEVRRIKVTVDAPGDRAHGLRKAGVERGALGGQLYWTRIVGPTAADQAARFEALKKVGNVRSAQTKLGLAGQVVV
jgi:hypothetical protein